jgi:hypothetical protein
MHAVINTLRFRESVDPTLFVRAEHEMAARCAPSRASRASGSSRWRMIQVVLVIFADAADVLDRMATELGNTWMGANVAPLLDGPPDRRIGPVIGSVSV